MRYMGACFSVFQWVSSAASFAGCFSTRSAACMSPSTKTNTDESSPMTNAILNDGTKTPAFFFRGRWYADTPITKNAATTNAAATTCSIWRIATLLLTTAQKSASSARPLRIA